MMDAPVSEHNYDDNATESDRGSLDSWAGTGEAAPDGHIEIDVDTTDTTPIPPATPALDPQDNDGQPSARDELIAASYAWIEITGGELPELLRAYDFEPLGDWTIWDMVFSIPRATAQELIHEISGRDGVEIIMSDLNAEHAVVLYSPNR